MLELNYPPLPPSPCPVNNFGKGVNYEPTDEDRIRFLTLWDDWESAHPDDPDGTQYITKYQAACKDTNPVPVLPPQTFPPSEESYTPKPCRKFGRPRTIFAETMQVRFIITQEQRAALQAKASRENRTMSDILRQAIDSVILGGK